MDTFLDAAAVVLLGLVAGCGVWLIWDPGMLPVKMFGTVFVLLIVTGMWRDAL